MWSGLKVELEDSGAQPLELVSKAQTFSQTDGFV